MSCFLFEARGAGATFVQRAHRETPGIPPGLSAPAIDQEHGAAASFSRTISPDLMLGLEADHFSFFLWHAKVISTPALPKWTDMVT